MKKTADVKKKIVTIILGVAGAATLLLLLGSLVAIHEVATIRLIVLTALIIFLLLGYQFIRTIRRETKQQHYIEKLVIDLEKANKRLKELDTLKTEFVSIASHQLRSPLAAVKGYASMLLEGSFGKLSVGAQEAIGRIFTSSSFMAHSVDDFLNVSRIELGRMKYDRSKFDICKVIDLVVEEQKPFARDKNLELLFENKTEKKECTVYADIGKIKQVLTNLVDNAIKYTLKGRVQIMLNHINHGEKILLTVEDTGMGMSPQTIERLFRKFSRADRANEVNVIGTGLGLYVAKSLIEAQNGKIWATSGGEGKGSVFHIEIPSSGETEH